MMMALKVVSRFQRRVADQPSNARKETRKLVTPVNKPKGVIREVVKEQGKVREPPDSVTPNRKDLQPKDLFPPLPKNVNVLNYALKGWPGTSDDYQDMDKALNKQIPKDKGYDTVNNLSQYLIKTEGGGDTETVERK